MTTNGMFAWDEDWEKKGGEEEDYDQYDTEKFKRRNDQQQEQASGDSLSMLHAMTLGSLDATTVWVPTALVALVLGNPVPRG
jgi:hypothetical protein